MFEKARRKLDETAFFVRKLRDEQNPDSVEFLFNALLNAGKNVVNSLQAQIHYREAQALAPISLITPTPPAGRFFSAILSRLTAYRARHAVKAATKQARKAYRSHFKAWRRTLTPEEADLFDVLQELRNIEVHAKDSASRHIPKLEERLQPRPLPSDPTYLPIFASYMAMGMLSHEVTVGETTYTFQVDAAALSEPAKRLLFQRFDKTKEKPTLEVGQDYARLLNSLVDYFLAHYA